ncbi:hypothetical protein G6O67_003434 [Ophiocordyceps sinensis]|nr:hypothetical protein G6O67_003434 [Ophiocordyceps sinensis]
MAPTATTPAPSQPNSQGRHWIDANRSSSRGAATSRDQSHRNPRRPCANSTSDAIFRPRPYEDIYAERAYLTVSLQVQSNKANELLRQYSWLEDEIQGLTASKQRRRLRKQLNLVRSRLGGAAEQEKAIFVRLSEVCMEVNSRDAWAQASRQRVQRRAVLGQPLSQAANRATSPDGSPRPSTHPNGQSPELTPTDPRAAQQPASAQTVPEAEPASLSPVMVASEGASHPGNSLLHVTDGGGDKCSSDGRMSYQYQEVAAQFKSWASPSSACRTGRDNRLSLPSLASIWPWSD